MTRYLEDELKEMFSEEAARAPRLPDPSVVLARAQNGRSAPHLPRVQRVRLAVGGAVLVAASVALALGVAGVFDDPRGPTDSPVRVVPSPSSRTPDAPVAPSPSGALPAPTVPRWVTSSAKSSKR